MTFILYGVNSTPHITETRSRTLLLRKTLQSKKNFQNHLIDYPLYKWYNEFVITRYYG